MNVKSGDTPARTIFQTGIPNLQGCAKYYADGRDVVMISDGFHSTIDMKSSPEAALKAAQAWQRKENRTWLKHLKYI